MFGMKCYNFLSAGCLIRLAIGLLLSSSALPQTSAQLLNQREGFFNKTSYVRLFSTLSLKQHIGLSFKTCFGGQLFSQRNNDQTITLEVLPEGLVFSVTLHSPTTLSPKHFESRISANFLNNVWHTVNILNRLGNLTISAAGHQQVVSNSTYNPEILMLPDVSLQTTELHVGHGFVGCILEGPSLVFNSTRVQPVNVGWGPCPLTPNSCTKVDYCSNGPCMTHGICINKPDRYQCHCAPRYTGNNCEHDTGSPCMQHPCMNGGHCKDTDIGDGYVCQCPNGFTGKHCETEVSSRLCENNPCHNGGTCRVTPGGNQYECICLPGFSGKDCETNVNECLSSPCQNGGTCIDGIDNYTCACNHTGYEGPNCEININECDRKPCMNGQCFDNYGGYTCQCAPGFGGLNCEMNLNECSSSPCRNDGVCVDIVGSYKCHCTAHFTGPNCEVSLKDCKTVPCPPSSACINNNGTFQCICKPGFVSVNLGGHLRCVESVDICTSTPCQNGGTCTPHPIDGFNCTCQPGFIGVFCESLVGMMPDWCSSAPCYNGGTCTNEHSTYNCHCPPPFTGARCETIIKCASKPCEHATSCDDYLGSAGYYCTCERGWTGQNCNIEIDECLSGPCQFGGTCIDKLAGFYCACPPGLSGDLCEKNINECSSQPCLNGGVCVDGINGYTCNCTEEFTGEICETLYDSCIDSPCKNNGTCVHLDPKRSRRDYFCKCQTGFEGPNCEMNIDDCVGIICPDNKKCVDGVNAYECLCPEGFAGDNCTIKLQNDFCNKTRPCKNGGTCIDGMGNYTCICPNGWTGRDCELDVDECNTTKPCKNGICQNTNGSYQCFCQPGFSGDHCDLDFDECLSQPCSNGASCVNMINNFRCDCTPGFTGRECKTNIDECESNPCVNGATCIDGVAVFSCKCPPGLTGRLCETNIDDCESSPCLNNGTCVDGINNYTCNCLDTGYEGMHCEINIDDCKSSPCENGAMCIDQVKDYRCNCFPGYTGKNCDMDINECESNPCQYGGTCLELSNSTLYKMAREGQGNGLPASFQQDFSYSIASGYTCLCVPGVRGDNCKENINECESNPCIHGKCHDQINNYSCECEEGYEGVLCESDINECERYRPCLKGECYDQKAGYLCECYPKFGGKNCTVELTGCISNECQNGGTCKPYLEAETNHLFNCTCPNGFHGKVCEKLTTMSLTGLSSYVIMNTTREEGYEIHFRFKTTLPNGLLALGKGSTFYILELVQGKLNLHSSLLNKWEGVSIGSKLTDSNWQKVFVAINTSHLVLAANEEQTIYPINQNEGANASHTSFPTTYVGGTVPALRRLPNGQQPYFIGCVQDIFINGQYVLPQEMDRNLENVEVGCPRKDQCQPNPCHSGGHCTDLWRNFSCTCERPYLGHTCQYNLTAATFGHEKTLFSLVTITVFPQVRQVVQSIVDISMFIRTRQDTGGIFYIGSKPGSVAYPNETLMTAQLNNGELQVRIQFNGVPETYSVGGLRLDDGNNHLIQVIRNVTLVQVKINSTEYFRKTISATGKLDLQVLFLGGIPLLNSRVKRQHNEEITGFKGVIQDVQVSNGSQTMVVEFFPLRESFPNDDLDLPPHLGEVNIDNTSVLKGIVSDDTCAENPCLQDGLCEVTWNDYICHCTRGYKGKRCEEMEFCQLKNCPAGSVCRNVNRGYECVANITLAGDGSKLSYRLEQSMEKNIAPQDIEIAYRSRTGGTLLWIGPDPQNREYYFQISVNIDEITVAWKLHSGNEVHRMRKGHSSDPPSGEWTTIALKMVNDTLNGRLLNTPEDTAQAQINNINFNSADWYDLILNSPITVGGTSLTQADKNSYITDSDDTNDVVSVYGLKQSAGGPYKGCIGEVRVGGLLLPYFTPAQLNVTNASSDHFVLNDDSSLDLTLDCLLCFQSECTNGGKCANETESYLCDCLPGFTGDNCSMNIDECQDNLCENGATCIDGLANYTCHCPPGWEKWLCDKEIDECESNPCKNNGTCYDKLGYFECVCMEEYVGAQCEQLRQVTCENKPCRNGASCADVKNTKTSDNFTCSCLEGFVGHYCETAYCDATPCLNDGLCDNSTPKLSPRCVCEPGFQGRLCEEDIDDCKATPCLHKGLCIDGVAAYSCDCIGTGYYGKNCERDVDECRDDPCMSRGVCENTDGSFICKCFTGYCGQNCSLPDPCMDNPCKMEGRCIPDCVLVSDYRCMCPVGLTGKNCTESNLLAQSNVYDIALIVGPVIAILLIAGGTSLTVFLMMARKKRATRGTYSPSSQEYCNPRVELDNVMKPPPEERLI